MPLKLLSLSKAFISLHSYKFYISLKLILNLLRKYANTENLSGSGTKSLLKTQLRYDTQRYHCV